MIWDSVLLLKKQTQKPKKPTQTKPPNLVPFTYLSLFPNIGSIFLSLIILFPKLFINSPTLLCK